MTHDDDDPCPRCGGDHDRIFRSDGCPNEAGGYEGSETQRQDRINPTVQRMLTSNWTGMRIAVSRGKGGWHTAVLMQGSRVLAECKHHHRTLQTALACARTTTRNQPIYGTGHGTWTGLRRGFEPRTDAGYAGVITEGWGDSVRILAGCPHRHQQPHTALNCTRTAMRALPVHPAVVLASRSCVHCGDLLVPVQGTDGVYWSGVNHYGICPVDEGQPRGESGRPLHGWSGGLA